MRTGGGIVYSNIAFAREVSVEACHDDEEVANSKRYGGLEVHPGFIHWHTVSVQVT